MKVLLVEDDLSTADLIATCVSAAQAGRVHVDHVPDLASAESRLLSGRYDVVLLDMMLPDGGGAEAFERVRRAGPATPVIILTASDDQQLVARTLRLGAQDYLLKQELSAAVLTRSVRFAIERHESINHRRRAEALEQEKASLRRAIEAMEQVLGVIGHELRTPLAGLRAMSELMLDEQVRRGERADFFVRSIHGEAVRMADIVNELLDAARICSGRAQWQWEEFSPAEVVEAAVLSVEPAVDAGSVWLSCDGCGDGHTMLGDAQAVGRLVLNLLSNARRHTARGQIRVQLRRGEQDGRWLEIRVTDTGSGIPAHILKRLGEPFTFSSGVAGVNHVSGTGLGVAICKGIAAAHGGDIRFESMEGSGTTVVVRLRTDLAGPADAEDDPMTWGDGAEEVLQPGARR